jgi:hypothetical protein
LAAGDGEGDAVACGCAKQKVANASTSSAARGKCLFIRSSPRSKFFVVS